MAQPAVKTDHNNNVASNLPHTNRIPSRICFKTGFTDCCETGNKFLARKNSTSCGESFENGGKYSTTFSLVHQLFSFLNKYKCNFWVYFSNRPTYLCFHDVNLYLYKTPRMNFGGFWGYGEWWVSSKDNTSGRPINRRCTRDNNQGSLS